MHSTVRGYNSNEDANYSPFKINTRWADNSKEPNDVEDAHAVSKTLKSVTDSKEAENSSIYINPDKTNLSNSSSRKHLEKCTTELIQDVLDVTTHSKYLDTIHDVVIGK